MINPQMMGAMGNMPNVPSVQELWKDEKSKYRHWIILLGIGLLAIFGVMVASFIFNIADRGNVVVEFKNNLVITTGSTGTKGELAKQMAGKVSVAMISSGNYSAADFIYSVNRAFTTNYIILPSFKLGALLIGITLYVSSLLTVYKEKNFARLSSWPTMIVGIAAFFAVFSMIPFGSNTSFSDRFAFSGGIFDFAANISFILIYFAASAPVSKLRRLFLLSERMEKIKEMQKSPQFQQMQQQFMQGQGAMGAFGQMAGMNPQTQPNPQAQGNTTQEGVTPATPQIDPEKKKLQAMTKDELIEVAKELSISGYSTMNKDELILAILRITQN